MMFQVEADTIISEVIENAPETVPMFQAIGMHCIGCAMASGESVAEACAVHGVDADLFVEKLNEFIAAQK
jgi:hybrid cluster-associated redox disulfide protein